MIEKRKSLFLAFIAVMLLCGCASPEISYETSPTGYPSGEVQGEFLYYGGTVYGNISENLLRLPEGLAMIGKVAKYDNTAMPDEEYEGSRALTVGTELYAEAAEKPDMIYAWLENGSIISLKADYVY